MPDPSSIIEQTAAEPAAPRPDEVPLKGKKRPSRTVAFVRGWIDEHLSREKVSSVVKTLLWVIPLTILIWIYAERQELAGVPGVTIPVEIVSNDPTKVFSIQSPASKLIVVKLVGPRAAVEQAQKLFNPLNGNPPAKILYDSPLDNASQRIASVRIREDKRLADLGVTVESPEPAEIKFYVDQLVEKEYRVEVADPRRFGSPPKFTPETVKVRGPSRVLNNPATTIRIEADIAAAMGRAPASDEPVQLSDVKLNVIGGDTANIALSPPAVAAIVTPVKAKEDTLPTVRVMIAAPKLVLDRYLIETVPSGVETIPNVLVSGPEELVNRLKDNSPVAFVEVSPAVLTEGEADVPIRYNLPPGVVLKDERKTLRIRATPR
ncbi:YbbR-like domain-containing protein [Humisphaera borealis]|uniref:YbbR-like domain-containing protein n=1 Tax=Humisphaera borealis TaxID=2807512 RepID=A0A7M2X1L6_9BACT|nr:hypothetical protein [Humisphaera borealis]QOV91646.1 hypothetical protein IPV69_09890 [Humisphaera borealis]